MKDPQPSLVVDALPLADAPLSDVGLRASLTASEYARRVAPASHR
jgi:hypothetical protein